VNLSSTQKVRNGAPHKHTFTKVFAEKTEQQALFEETALPMVNEMFKGNNSLLFTYGVTNAGKTYTVQGNAEEPGVVPRSLDVIFNSIGEGLVGEPTVRPYCFDLTKPVTGADKLGLEQLRSDCQAAHTKVTSSGRGAGAPLPCAANLPAPANTYGRAHPPVQAGLAHSGGACTACAQVRLG